jgi:hypothetical protein
MMATNVRLRQLGPLPDIGAVEPLNEKNAPVMAELYEVLKRHGALGRFGVTLLHQHFDIAEDEVLLERTDPVSRRQVIEPVKINTLDGKNPIQTSWRLDTGMPSMYCVCVEVGIPSAPRHEHFDNSPDE